MTPVPRATPTLILMRHGKSGYPDGVRDHERPLADRGVREATLAGEWMRRDGFAIDTVLCSSARRTRETVLRAGIGADVVLLDELYGGSPDDVIAAIRAHVPPDAATVLVVGHEPGMPATALTLDPSADIDRFPTSAYAVLELAVPWGRVATSPTGIARLVAFRVPR